MNARKEILKRIYISFFLICFFGLVILFKISKIQFYEGAYWKSKADSMTIRIANIDAARGNIYASDGSPLAFSMPIYDIHFDAREQAINNDLFNSGIDSLALGLSRLFDDKTPQEYRAELYAARADTDGYHLIRRGITYAQLQELKKLPIFRLGRYKGGLRVDERSVRELPFRQLAQRTIGTMREVKPVGIEDAFNSDLKGLSGKRMMQKISGNTWKPVNDKDEIEPKDGNDIYTTIDLNIQDVAESSLERHLHDNNADHGCAVLMEVQTGEIKAIANLSRTKEGTYIENFNYAIAEATEPGSTFKLASLLAALDDRLIDTGDVVTVNDGKVFYFGRKMEDSHPPHSSRLTVKEVFETSSNVGTSQLIYKNYRGRPNAFIEKVKSFGLGTPLGLQIKGEGSPLIKDNTDKTWSALSLPWISIGYESKLTPLQILAFYNAVANDGKMVQPHIVREIRHSGQLVKSFPVEIMRDSIASPASLAKARAMMEGVVQHGTASTLRNSPFKIAGKTGTAQINNPKFGYDKAHLSYQASFVGYFPADQPRYSCIVVVYAPSNNVYYGGAVAAPIFKEIADKVYSTHLEMHTAPLRKDTSEKNMLPLVKAGASKDVKKVIDAVGINCAGTSTAGSWVSATPVEDRIELSPRTTPIGRVPNVVGMGAMDALFLLENAGLQVKLSGKGDVVAQSITPGTAIRRGQTIEIALN
jgi:cell division protein FtsI (penicillin-binding protein 3)